MIKQIRESLFFYAFMLFAFSYRIFYITERALAEREMPFRNDKMNESRDRIKYILKFRYDAIEDYLR